MENNPTGNIGRVNGTEMRSPSALPLPGSIAYGNLPQFPKHGVLPFRRTIRRHELHQIVPLAETTIYEMEQRGEFPRRFRLTAPVTAIRRASCTRPTRAPSMDLQARRNPPAAPRPRRSKPAPSTMPRAGPRCGSSGPPSGGGGGAT